MIKIKNQKLVPLRHQIRIEAMEKRILERFKREEAMHKMKLNHPLEIGTEIFNGGDMANKSHFGSIISVKSDHFGIWYEIKINGDSERNNYELPAYVFSEEYKGHGGTRIVTKVAYLAYRKIMIDQMNNDMKNRTARRVS